MTIFVSLLAAFLFYEFQDLASRLFVFTGITRITREADFVYYFALPIICFGIALYALRTRARIAYGLLELFISIGLIIVALGNYIALSMNVNANHIMPYLSWHESSASLFQVAAAIYVFVRAMDNIGEGLNEFPQHSIAKAWMRLFSRREELNFTWWQLVRRNKKSAQLPDDDDGQLQSFGVAKVDYGVSVSYTRSELHPTSHGIGYRLHSIDAPIHQQPTDLS